MARFNLSVHAHLTVIVAALVAIVIGLSAVAATSLIIIDGKAEAVDQKWLASTELLGEWSDRISEFRLAETYRAIANTAEARAAAEQLADEHRGVIASLKVENLKLHGGNTAELAAFGSAWTASCGPRCLGERRYRW